MKALITPGQGEISSDLLTVDYEEKRKWRSVAESLLGKNITAENLTEHDVNSAVIVANALACFHRYRSIGGDTGMVAGYSVGQYAALAMAGIIGPETALTIAIERARIMRRHTLPDMRMMGVTGLPRETIYSLIAELTDGIEQTDCRFIEISNFNNSMNFTVAGNLDLLNNLASKLERAGAMKAELLDTEGAWHSRMLKPALGEFTSLINGYSFLPPEIPFADNVTGEIESDPDIIRKNLVDHMVSPVRWEELTRSLIAAGADMFLECGAGKLLTKILFFIDRRKPCIPLSSLEEIGRCAALPA